MLSRDNKLSTSFDFECIPSYRINDLYGFFIKANTAEGTVISGNFNMTSKNKPSSKRVAATKAKPEAKKNSVSTAKKAATKKISADVTKTKADKSANPQLVRDSFTIPESEYVVLAKVKKACIKEGFDIKKSEMIRIGIALIAGLSVSKVKSAKKKLQTVKTGRPRKDKLEDS